MVDIRISQQLQWYLLVLIWSVYPQLIIDSVYSQLIIDELINEAIDYHWTF